QISDAMLDVLRAEGIATLTILADGERPKILQDGTPAPHSQGQRLALRVAQRAEDAAICARLTEPERAPDGPKVDADSLLRDHGPEALRALVRAALPLALYRRKVGAEPDAAPLALVAELRDERDRERREKGEVIRELRVLRGTLANTAHKQLARAAIGIAAEVQERLTNTTDRGADIHIVKETGERFVRVNNGSAGRRVGLSDDTMGTAVKQLAKLGKLSKITRSAPGTFRDKTTGELKEGWIKQVFVSLPATDSTTWLEEQIVPLSPDKETPHWGRRPGLARCERHPDAPTKTTTTRTITCAECGEVLEQTITGETYQDQDGRPLTEGDIRRMAATKPKVSGVKDTNTEGGLEASDHAPVECRPPLPKVSVTPPPPIDLATHRPPRCMHCGERMPAGDARHYCPRCRADGWHDPRPPAAATGGADPPGDQVPAAGD
ncbi:MAG: hypothetical protein AVDCRST_MAG88-51, partial [uncultured Thermomicrobiales bacterium]